MTRAEHLDWSKQRALACADAGDLVAALSSLASDLAKHPETAGHPAIPLGVRLAAGGHLATRERMRQFIENFR